MYCLEKLVERVWHVIGSNMYSLGDIKAYSLYVKIADDCFTLGEDCKHFRL